MRKRAEREMPESRRPFVEPGESRRPTLTWPRQIPIDGEPADVVAIVDDYARWLATSDVPKLFVNAEPGTILTGPQREFCRTWPSQQEITVRGSHFVQEDSPREVGAEGSRRGGAGRGGRDSWRVFGGNRQEVADHAQELVEAVVVQPVPGALDADDGGVAERLGAAVRGRIAGAALGAVEQERGTGDARPQVLDVLPAHVVRRKDAHVVVELPAIGAVLVLVHAVHRQMARLLGGEMRVLLLHTTEGVLDRAVPTGQTAREPALLEDPLVHAQVDAR